MKATIEITPDMIDQIPLSEIINHFGKDKILKEMEETEYCDRLNDALTTAHQLLRAKDEKIAGLELELSCLEGDMKEMNYRS